MPRSPHRSRPRVQHVLAVAALATLALSGCTSATPQPTAPSSAPPSTTATPAPGTANCDYPAGGTAARTVDPPATTGVPATGTVKYTLALTGGPVTVTLDRSKAPCTVNSFTSLADQGYFDGTRCHRMLDTGIFILQCGDPTGSGMGGPGYTFADELTGEESYTTGVVAMANAGPGTNGSQFFLIWDDSTGLDKGTAADPGPNYTIFGQMDPASRDVVATMAGEGRDAQDRPNNPSEISKVTKG